jgi:hypothetical protein
MYIKYYITREKGQERKKEEGHQCIITFHGQNITIPSLPQERVREQSTKTTLGSHFCFTQCKSIDNKAMEVF